MYLNTTRGLCRTSPVASPVHCRPATRMACSASTSNCGPSCDGDPVERTRQRMNYTNNWHRKPVDELQQVTWDRPLRQDPLVAVIGGGLSGLACAHGLARHGIRSVVFDTGEHSVGGRLGTRSRRDGSLHPDWLPADLAGVDLAFDHAAQCFTATDPRFQAVVDSWVQRGLVRAWHTADQPCVGVLTAPAAVQQPSAGPSSNSSTSSSTRPAGSYQALPADLPLYIATRGMRSLAIDMAEQGGAVSRFMSLQRPMWVSRVAAAPQKGGFQLSGNPTNEAPL